ncbi:hypothetical protein P22_1617 [Propionispora sp. 2/2-37]|uniref:hypothetical protein n=1 Tax=Propionispora sp. 2/2-37 TaxID=1677858 RepID=UPI0006BB7A35|nr:hypothetical protein [Propionispora sp. 2/2-37]CUH95546.1 hypothetical protein P22_1617 [Propionispora sp. 2/2-37]
MKPLILTGFLLYFIGFNINNGFAAPVPVTDDLNELNSAYGFMIGNHSNTYYIANKTTDTLTLGLQSTSWKNKHTVTDLFGELDGTDESKFLVGVRNFDSRTRAFIGMTKLMPATLEWNTYMSALIGKGFHELEVGAIYSVTENTDLNFSYDYYRYQGSRTSFNIGLTYKAW